MKEFGTVCVALAIPCAIAGVVLMMSMAAALEARGHTIRWIWIRLFVFEYIHRYRGVTRHETGRSGPLFTTFIVVMNAALVLAVAGMILRAA